MFATQKTISLILIIKFMFSKKLLVAESELHGKGLFISSDIKEGSIITHISGEMIDESECVRRENEENNVYIFYKNDDEYIDVSKNELLKYINHSCNYNCDVDEDENNNLILYAVTDIQAGSELTIDYGYDEIYDYCSCSECENKPDEQN